MPLKAVLKTLDGLEPAIAALYAEGDDGVFYLDLDGVDEHKAVKSLKTAHERAKKEAKDLREAAKKWEGKDPAKYDEMIAAAEEAEERARTAGDDKNPEVAKIHAGYKKQIETMEAKHKAELEKRDGLINTANGRVRKLAIESELDKAIDAAGVKPEYKKAVKAMMKERALDVIEDGEDVRGVFKTDIGDEPISEHIEKWAKSDDAAHYLPPDRKVGSGAPAGGNRRQGAGVTTFDKNDPIAWGRNAEALSKGEARPV